MIESDYSRSEAPEESSAWDEVNEVPFAGDELKKEEAHTISLPELPTKSPDWTCGFYLREIMRQGAMPDIKDYLETTLSHEHQTFASEEELNQFCDNYADQLSDTLTKQDKAALKNYTGFEYKYINQVARGQWNYDLLGARTPENMAATRQSIEELSNAITDAPEPETDLIAYRGTNLDSFHGYHINSISDLASLKNQFFLETGFTSTSIDPKRSFANREDFDDPLRKACNITLEYIIPAGCKEVAGLFSTETTYNPEQRELVMDKDSLSYISDVEINPQATSAKLKMALIPRQMYDPATRQK